MWSPQKLVSSALLQDRMTAINIMQSLQHKIKKASSIDIRERETYQSPGTGSKKVALH